jgi:hypothetical protein
MSPLDPWQAKLEKLYSAEFSERLSRDVGWQRFIKNVFKNFRVRTVINRKPKK